MSNLYKYTTKELEEFRKGLHRDKKKFAGAEATPDDIFINGRIIVPVEKHTEILRGYFDNPETGFVGRDKLFYKIKDDYIGISRNDIAAFLKNSQTAQLHQIPRNVKINRPMTPSKPLTNLAIDLTFVKEADQSSLVSLVNKDIEEPNDIILLTCIDTFSKYGWAFIVPNKKAETIAGKFEEGVLKDKHAGLSKDKFVDRGSSVRAVHSDNGTEFRGDFSRLLKKWGIKQVFNRSHSPQDNGIIERFNRTIKGIIYKFLSQYNGRRLTQKDLDDLVHNYNTNIHSTTKMSPYEIIAEQGDVVVRARRNIKKRANKLLKQNAVNFEPIEVGDHVRVARRVFPEFRAARANNTRAYLKNYSDEIYKVVRVIWRKPPIAETYEVEGLPNRLNRQDLLKVDPDNLIVDMARDEYVIEKILDVRGTGKNKLYLVKWKGYGSQHNEWIKPQESFADAINQYEAKQAKRAKRTRAKKVPAKAKAPAKAPAKVPTRATRAAPAEPPKMSLSRQFAVAEAAGIVAGRKRSTRP